MHILFSTSRFIPRASNRKARSMSGGRSALLILTLLGVAPGCINMHPTRSGFLTDYSALQPLDKRDRVRVRPVACRSLDAVDSFYIEPVTWLADDMGQPASNARNQEAIRNSLQEALVKELSCIRPIAD